MGYHTDLPGEFKLDKPLAPEHLAYLKAFNATRRMKRDAAKTATLPDPIRLNAGLPIGEDAEYYVNDKDADILDDNNPPGSKPGMLYGMKTMVPTKGCQPGLWCPWTPNAEGTEIVWDEGEKPYHYIDWLDYLIARFIKPWGYTLNGMVEWTGEESGDMGRIRIKNNVVTAADAVVTFPGAEDDD